MFMQNTCGDLESWIDALQERVPMSGPCPSARNKNKSLDRFRRATNVVYDIFNNGLMNRARELKVLDKKLRKRDLPLYVSNQDKWDIIEQRIAPFYRDIVQEAVLEQFGRDEWIRMMHNKPKGDV